MKMYRVRCDEIGLDQEVEEMSASDAARTGVAAHFKDEYVVDWMHFIVTVQAENEDKQMIGVRASVNVTYHVFPIKGAAK